MIEAAMDFAAATEESFENLSKGRALSILNALPIVPRDKAKSDALCLVFAKHPEAAVRKKVAQYGCLGEQAQLQLMNDEDENVRTALARNMTALGTYGSPGMIVQKLLNDPSENVYQATLMTLGRLVFYDKARLAEIFATTEDLSDKQLDILGEIGAESHKLGCINNAVQLCSSPSKTRH